MKKVIGVTGTIAAGKDAVADYIADKLSIPKFEISAGLKEIATQRGIEITRENLVELGRKVAEEFGHDYLARYALDKITDTGLISGIRQIPQIEYLKAHSEFVLIGVDADPQLRFERAMARGKAGEAKSQEEFVANEIKENSGTVQRLFDCMKLADFTLLNNTTLVDLKTKVDRLPFMKN